MRAFRRLGLGRHAVPRRAGRWLAFGAVVMGMAAGVPVALGGQVSAAGLTPVIFTGFTVAPADGPTITYGDTAVTVSGRLVEYSSQDTGVPGEQVQIEFGNTAAGTATTGADGRFSATVSLPEGGWVWAEFSGDTTYGPSRTGTILVHVTPALTRVTLNAQPALVAAGTELTFTGKAEVQVAGTWEPLPNARVDLAVSDSPYASISHATTDADGTFSLPGTATGWGQWLAEVETQGGLYLYDQSWSNIDPVGVIYRTRIAAFSLPATHEAHTPLTITGTAQVWNGAAWTGYDGMQVLYYYQVQGTSTWVLAGGAYTNASGGFGTGASFRLGHLIYQVRVPAYVSGNKFLVSASTTHTSFITDHTCVTNFAISHFYGRTLVHAWIRDWCANGQVTFGQVKGRVANVYYHPRGTTTWRLIAQPHTDANGFVDYTRYSVLRGYFKVVFPAQGYYLASASNSVYAS